MHVPVVTAGQVLAPQTLTTARGGSVAVPDPDQVTHLQFRRYAGCPICNLHLRSFVTRHDEIAAANIREIAVFHSSQSTLAEYQQQLPFDLVADPDRTLYRQFGVGTSVRSITHPSAMAAAVRGYRRGLPPGSDTGSGGHLGLPADFLIAPDGTVLACKYGAHANDQWTIDDLLALAGGQRA